MSDHDKTRGNGVCSLMIIVVIIALILLDGSCQVKVSVMSSPNVAPVASGSKASGAEK